jgi:hypothetical protein
VFLTGVVADVERKRRAVVSAACASVRVAALIGVVAGFEWMAS